MVHGVTLSQIQNLWAISLRIISDFHFKVQSLRDKIVEQEAEHIKLVDENNKLRNEKQIAVGIFIVFNTAMISSLSLDSFWLLNSFVWNTYWFFVVFASNAGEYFYEKLETVSFHEALNQLQKFDSLQHCTCPIIKRFSNRQKTDDFSQGT